MTDLVAVYITKANCYMKQQQAGQMLEGLTREKLQYLVGSSHGNLVWEGRGHRSNVGLHS